MQNASYVILFVSRNKDNENVAQFKSRRRAFLWNQPTLPIKRFESFVAEGVPGEVCRMYQSVNARNVEKVRKALIVKLVTADTMDLTKIEGIVASLAALSENKAESKWLFDFDSTDENKQEVFYEDLRKLLVESYKGTPLEKTAEIVTSKTPNGMHYIIPRGVDTRELLKKWEDTVTLKRDDMRIVAIQRKRLP